jgi:protein-disulfide isomerase
VKRLSLLAALAVLTVTAAVPGEAQRRAAAQDWTRVAVRTPEGGFRMGNPAARLKVVEYLSLTCSHCADFARDGYAGMLGLVRSGRVSIEYRNYIRDGLDITAALVSRCAAPVNYFAMTHALLTTQAAWTGRTQSLTPAQAQEIGALQPVQIAQRLVPILGLDALGQRYGVTAASRQRCLSQAGINQLRQIRQAADAAGVQGTPTFFINGAIANANTWAGLEPLLR